MNKNLSILIVGAGPTGMMLGCRLLQEGLFCRIIDRRSIREDATRAIGVTGSTLKLFSELGIAQNFLKCSLVTDRIQFYWEGKSYLSLKAQFVYSTQPLIEAALEQKFLSLGGQIEWDTELTELNAIDVGNRIILVKQQQSLQEDFTYVIGCDGGQSIVRSKMQVEYEREDYQAFFCLADLELDSAIEGTYAHYFLTEQGYCMLIPIPGNRYRVIFSFLGEHTSDFHKRMNAKEFENLVAVRTKKNIKVKTVIWKTSGPFRYQVVLNPVENRLVLAGDALHVFSPIGGTNMNFGLLDAAKLADCFAQITNGQSSQSVLSAYADNRLKVMRENMQVTRAATYLITRSPQRDLTYEKKFEPCRENCHFLRAVLPKQLSLENYY